MFGPPAGAPETTTLAANDFDVDTRTGFMPPRPPLARLPVEWEAWESTLDAAISQKLQLGETRGLLQEEQTKSEKWRKQVRNLTILPLSPSLTNSEISLRRARHVLVWILHFYVHSCPPPSCPPSPVHIPAPIALPLLQINTHLQLPPVLTYSDTVLYNWTLISHSDQDSLRPTFNNIKCQTTFSGTNDEAEFFLTSARIELRGVDALDVIQVVMDEIFVGDDIAVRRVTGYLHALAGVVREIRDIMLALPKRCDPEVFHHKVRPWFRGVDSPAQSAMATKVAEAAGRAVWIFEGIENDPSLSQPTNMSGPSAGQSTLIHALDIFLGVDQHLLEPRSTVNSPITAYTTTPSSPSVNKTVASQAEAKENFMQRMQAYMPRYHRAFLAHLSTQSRPLRGFVEKHSGVCVSNNTESDENTDGAALKQAYNDAILALKEFRDAHIQIVALYIIAPAAKASKEIGERRYEERVRGTGGMEVVKFLKGIREKTKDMILT